MLHDIGKMGVPDHILLKEGPLNDEEWEIMRKHPVFAYDMLSTIPFLKKASDVPYCHHEKWDGTGYPRGLRGKKFPLVQGSLPWWMYGMHSDQTGHIEKPGLMKKLGNILENRRAFTSTRSWLMRLK